MKKLIVLLMVVTLYVGLAAPTQMEKASGKNETDYLILPDVSASKCFLILINDRKEFTLKELSFISLNSSKPVGKDSSDIFCESFSAILDVTEDKPNKKPNPFVHNFKQYSNIVKNLLKSWIEGGIWIQLLF